MTTLAYNIHCCYSGIYIGKLDYMVVAGHMPYLSHWDNMTALHPIFSFPQAKLLAFARSEWNRLSAAVEDEQATEVEETQLRVCFLAVLHSLDSIKQESPSLPAMHIVQSNMSKLFKLAFWYNYLDSKRFRFPSYKINKANQNTAFTNISDYLELCFDIKTEYEEGIDDLVEAEKIAAAERALLALRNSWIVPASNNALWRWISANLPERYESDKQGWMVTIFCGSDSKILSFEKEDIALLEEIIVSEMPIGTPILSAVRARLDYILKTYTDHKEAFTVDFDDFDFDESMAAARSVSIAPASVEAPKVSDFPTKIAYIKANALYYLQQRKAEGVTL